MSDRLLLAQLSDTHLGADWGIGDPEAGLRAAVEALRALHPAPAAVLVSGDLVTEGTDAEYTQLRELLEPLGVPVHPLPGNHDDRAALRRSFALPGAGDGPVHYAVELGPARLLALDSTVPGEDGGALDAGQLAWLAAELTAHPDTPTLIAMHHPPMATGIPALDAMGLPASARRSLGELVARHDQVARLVAGHFHRTIAGELGGRPVLVVPSTFVQMRLDFGMRELEMVAEPPAFAVHAFRDGELASHVQPVAA